MLAQAAHPCYHRRCAGHVVGLVIRCRERVIPTAQGDPAAAFDLARQLALQRVLEVDLVEGQVHRVLIGGGCVLDLRFGVLKAPRILVALAQVGVYERLCRLIQGALHRVQRLMLRGDHTVGVHLTVKQQVPGPGTACIGRFGRATHRTAVTGVVRAIATFGGDQWRVGHTKRIQRLQLTVDRVLAQVHLKDAPRRTSGGRGRGLRHHRITAVHHVHGFISQQIGTANPHGGAGPYHDELGQ